MRRHRVNGGFDQRQRKMLSLYGVIRADGVARPVEEIFKAEAGEYRYPSTFAAMEQRSAEKPSASINATF